MPPKRSRLSDMDPCSSRIPCVMLGPLQDLDEPQLFKSTPSITSVYNQKESSDMKLIVNDSAYYVHKLVLSAASDVFASMFSKNGVWKESGMTDLELTEEEDCSKVFDDFLFYMYSGTIKISDQHAIPLFVLADKYNVKPLYAECVKVIEKGLKVYVVKDPHSSRKASISYFTKPRHRLSSVITGYESESDSDSESQIWPVKHLVGSETFQMSLVIKMLAFCHNEVIAAAAQRNLQARLRNQLHTDNYSVWNDLPKDLLLHMLADDYFYCNEFTLFKAAKSWLVYKPTRSVCPQGSDIRTQVLSCIRYGIMSTEELYHIDKDSFVAKSTEVVKMVNKAIRYKLFANCSAVDDQEWSDIQFQLRKVSNSD